MFDSAFTKFRDVISLASHHARGRLSRFGRAWAYAFRNIDRNDAGAIIADCQQAVGQFPLTILAVEDVLELAHAEYGYHTALPAFAEEACAVVALNWRGNSRDLASAQDWAFSIVRRSVEATGIPRCDPAETASSDAPV